MLHKVLFLLLISGLQNFIGPKLYDAAKDGDIDVVDSVMKKGADVHWKNPSDYGK